MKVRDSSMPEQQQWASYFDPPRILKSLDISNSMATIVEFGCGYGTFTIPAAQLTDGNVHAFDIEPEMIKRTQQLAAQNKLTNILACQRDFIALGTDMANQSTDYAMLFNILHAAEADTMLAETYRILKPNAILAIIHWNPDPCTPRGPSLDIRPTPEQCQTLATDAGFKITKPHIDLPPYHFGVVARKS